MNSSQLATALHCFGSRYAHAQSKIKKSGLSARKKFKRGGIHVQPEAVKRRKDGQSKTRKTLVNKKPSKLSFLFPDNSNYGRERKHDFTQIQLMTMSHQPKGQDVLWVQEQGQLLNLEMSRKKRRTLFRRPKFLSSGNMIFLAFSLFC